MLFFGRNVLELGAGGGLPGLVAANCGARKVRTCVCGNGFLLANASSHAGLQRGAECLAPAARRHGYCVRAGVRVGSPAGQLIAALQDTAIQVDLDPDAGRGMRFDLILLSDLIFNHSQVRHHYYHHNHLPPTFCLPR